MSLIEQIDKNRLPQHVAIIMDGNGRWAKAKGKDRSYGHQEGVVSVRKVVEAATTVGLKYLTMYTFSTENGNRPGGGGTGVDELAGRSHPSRDSRSDEK